MLKDGKTIGLSTYTGYTYNERAMLSLGVIDVAHSEPGAQVTLVWGEEAADRLSQPSSAIGKSRSGPRLPPCLTPKWRAWRTVRTKIKETTNGIYFS